MLFSFYLYIVGISSYKNDFLVDKEYTLYCPLPEYRRTCEINKKRPQVGCMSRHAITYV